MDGLQRIIEAQRDLSFPSGHTGSSFAAAVVIFLTCPGKIGVPALDPGISDHVFKTLCRSALSDGRSCRNDHGDTDRSAGMQGVSEKTQKSFRIIIYKKHPGQSKSAGVFFLSHRKMIFLHPVIELDKIGQKLWTRHKLPEPRLSVFFWCFHKFFRFLFIDKRKDRSIAVC